MQAVLQHRAAVALCGAEVALFFPRAGRRVVRSAFLPRCLLPGAVFAYRYTRQLAQECHSSIVFHGVFHLFSIPYVVVYSFSSSKCVHWFSGSVCSHVSVQIHGSGSTFASSLSALQYLQSAQQVIFFHTFSAYCLNLYLTFPCRCGKLFHRATPRVLKAQPQRPWAAGWLPAARCASRAKKNRSSKTEDLFFCAHFQKRYAPNCVKSLFLSRNWICNFKPPQTACPIPFFIIQGRKFRYN